MSYDGKLLMFLYENRTASKLSLLIKLKRVKSGSVNIRILLRDRLIIHVVLDKGFDVTR